MAEKTSSKNQQFLQQFERQRLNKPCNRVIDLRGKVAGECQAYMFGGKTHYLDDRAYLLAKQLLDHFNGQYTFGVYEAILKALKSLSTSDNKASSPSEEEHQSEIQLLSFDQKLDRKEPRIIYATPIELRLSDVLYHGSTIDITTSAINVTLKRTYTLDENDKVMITFPELATNEQDTLLLSKVAYTIFKINHDELRTQLVLVRERHENETLTQWLDKWSHHRSGENLDLDNELFNLFTSYYLRLYCHTLNSALLWINPQDKENPINALQINEAAEKSFQHDSNLDLSLLPFESIISEPCDFLLLIPIEKNTKKHFLAQRNNPQELANVLNWHSQQAGSQVFLIQTSSIDSAHFKQEIESIADADIEPARTLKQRLMGISQITTVTNITQSCQYLAQASKREAPEESTESWDGFIPAPTAFRHHIQRDNQRFVIRTSIQLHSSQENRLFSVITTDVSSSGLSITLPGLVDLKVGSHVSIDFTRWQDQTTKVVLTKLPYIVRNIQLRAGATHLGLERDVYSCDINVNKFFTTTIEQNKEQLLVDNTDFLISQETKILSSLLAIQLTTIPFYLARDDNNQRYLQAVSVKNSDAHYSPLWQEIQQQVFAMSQLLKARPGDVYQTPSFGLYCYQDNLGKWKVQADYTLSSAAQKSLLINQALRHELHFFYHCTLSPITSSLIEQEGDLNQQILQIRTQSPHKVKQVRQTLHSLFAVGELIDITDIITANYQ